MSSTGVSIRRSSRFGSLASMISTGRGRGGVIGLRVGLGAAEQPGDFLQRPLRRRQPDPLHRRRARIARSPLARSSRSSVRNRCAPRFVAATAWISSTITVSTSRRISRDCDVSSRYSDSGVVIRMSGGCANDLPAVGGRRVAGAHGHARQRERRAIALGDGLNADERRPQIAIDVDGQRLERRDVEDANGVEFCPLSLEGGAEGGDARAANINRSIAARNAASVLPEPVGASSRARLRAEASTGHASRWIRVGASSASPNQVRVQGWSDSMPGEYQPPAASSARSLLAFENLFKRRLRRATARSSRRRSRRSPRRPTPAADKVIIRHSPPA